MQTNATIVPNPEPSSAAAVGFSYIAATNARCESPTRPLANRYKNQQQQPHHAASSSTGWVLAVLVVLMSRE
jgi:hypothetical protein